MRGDCLWDSAQTSCFKFSLTNLVQKVLQEEVNQKESSAPTPPRPVHRIVSHSSTPGCKDSCPQSTSPHCPHNSSSVLHLNCSFKWWLSSQFRSSLAGTEVPFRTMHGTEKDHSQLQQPLAHKIGGIDPCLPLKEWGTAHPEGVGNLWRERSEGECAQVEGGESTVGPPPECRLRSTASAQGSPSLLC